MKTKLILLLVLTAFTTLAMTTTPSPVSACSGDLCNCYIESAICRESCPPFGQPGHTECMGECRRQEKQCAICCCCINDCPWYC